jgi:hypothetical protein
MLLYHLISLIVLEFLIFNLLLFIHFVYFQLIFLFPMLNYLYIISNFHFPLSKLKLIIIFIVSPLN